MNSTLPSSFKFVPTVPSPPPPQLSSLQSRVLQHHIPLGLPGPAATTTGCKPHSLLQALRFLLAFLVSSPAHCQKSHKCMELCSLQSLFPLGNPALLCCPSPLFTPGFPNLIKGLGGQTELSHNFPVREKAPAFVGMCQGAAPTSDNAPGFVSYTTTTYLKLMP